MQDMEQREWSRLASLVRQQSGLPQTRQQATEEQQATDREWRKVHPYFYHAYGPRLKSSQEEQSIGVGPASPQPPSPRAAPSAAPSRPAASSQSARPSSAVAAGVPSTVLAPLGDAIRDFDGVRAVRARLPRLGTAPSELTEVGNIYFFI